MKRIIFIFIGIAMSLSMLSCAEATSCARRVPEMKRKMAHQSNAKKQGKSLAAKKTISYASRAGRKP